MSAFLAWLKSKNITAHTIAASCITLATLITTNEHVRDVLIGALKNHPVIGSDIVLAAAAIFRYSKSSSPAGTVAAARQVLSQPDAPTAKAVDAATPPKGA